MEQASVEIWTLIIDSFLYDKVIYEPSIVLLVELFNIFFGDSDENHFRDRAGALRLVSKSWSRYIDTRYTVFIHPDCSQSQFHQNPHGAIWRACGHWDHISELHKIGAGSITVMVLNCHDPEAKPLPLEELLKIYHILATLPHLATLHISINSPTRLTIAQWLNLERVVLPKLAFLNSARSDWPIAGLLPLELPLLRALAVENMENPVTVQACLPHLLERHGVRLQEFSLNNKYTVQLPSNFSALVPRLTLLQLDVRTISLGTDSPFPPNLKRIIHSDGISRRLWYCDIIQYLLGTKGGAEKSGVETVEMIQDWDDHDAGSENEYETISRTAEILAARGVRLQDGTGRLWAERTGENGVE